MPVDLLDEPKTRHALRGAMRAHVIPSSRRFGPAEITVAKIQTISENRGIDVAFVYTADAPGGREAFESATGARRPEGTLQSVSVPCGLLTVLPDVSGAASGAASEATSGTRRRELATATTLCPGDKEWKPRLVRPSVRAYERIQSHHHGVRKVGIRVS
jgi:threonine dehydrogenase-like Zn-dependent dehydrogenase